MKNLPITILLLILSLPLYAATSITTPSVSGHWTLAGSPYKIYNSISINAGQTLIIDPGVDVVFQGPYALAVFGVLNATGTSLQRILFHAQDTTAGWGGINFKDTTAGTPDLSTFEYCNVSDMKAGGVFNVSEKRVLDIKNCNFNHNSSSALSMISISGKVNFSNCNFYDNHSASVAVIGFYMESNKSMSYCNVYDNTSVHDIIRIQPTWLSIPQTMLIEQCNVYQNHSTGSLGGAIITNWNNNIVIIRKSKVHHNTMQTEAAITLNGGTGDINGNLICNNEHLNSGFCGWTEGGGGIRLTNNGGYSDFTIRNNVIANNYSGFYGGGIFALHANVKIINNTIINNAVSNSSILQAAGIDVGTDSAIVYIKNNIIYNNKVAGTGTLANIHSGSNGATLIFENNWLQRPLSVDLDDPGGSILYYGDTLTNIIGTTPNLVAPTITASSTESALSANFSLLNTSFCINSGDTTSAHPYATDYNNISRIVGTSIDIGACEFNSFCPDPISGITNICVGATTTLSHPVAGGTWSSPHSSVLVTVNPTTGDVTGIAGGVATIYYKVGSCLASTNVKVHSLPTTILGPGNVCMGSTITLVSYPTGGTWAASNSTASISPAGIVTPVAHGIDTFSYTVTNMCGTVTITRSINIDTLPMPITGPFSVCTGDSATLSSSGTGVWINPRLGGSFINYATGVYAGVSPGFWEIIYQLTGTGCTTSATVTVNPHPVLHGYTGYACIGVPKNLSADIPGGTWTSDNVAVATIDPATGVAMGVSTGTSNITYTTIPGCYNTVILSADLCTEEVQTAEHFRQIQVYPNPASDGVWVATPKKDGMVELLNVVGVKVLDQKVLNDRTYFDVNNLPRGLYLVIWRLEGETVVKKIILE